MAKENKLRRNAYSFKPKQIEDLARISREQTEKQGRDVSAAELVREGADYVIAKYSKDK